MALKTGILLLVIVVAAKGTLSSKSSDCFQSFGIANSSKVKDSQLSASSYLYSDRAGIYHFKPYYARLHTTGGGGAWCSENTNKGQYIQVDFLHNVRIRYIQTQGRYRGAEFIQSYKLKYQRNKENEWRLVYDRWSNEKIFPANNNTDTVVGNYLPYAIIARKVRLYAKGDFFSIDCLRMEMFGCPLKSNNIDLKSYSAPAGIKLGELDLTDKSYDGELNRKADIFSHGLGELSDGFYGSSDLRNGWIGFNLSRIEITFEFLKPKSFAGLVIHARNMQGRRKPIERLEIESSNDGLEYHLLENFTNFIAEPPENEFKKRLSVVVAKWMKCIVFQKPGNTILISEITYIQGTRRHSITTTTAIPVRSTHIVKRHPKTRAQATTREKVMKKIISTKLEGNTRVKSEDSMSENKKVVVTVAASESADSIRARGGSKRTKSFYIIVGVATFIAALFTILIVLFVWFLKKDIPQGTDKKQGTNSQNGSDMTKFNEPLLKLIQFQGVCGTSRFACPEMIKTNRPLADREIPRAAVEFENKIGGGKFGEVFIGQIVCPMDGSLSLSKHSLIGHKIFIEVLKKGASVEANSQLDEEIQALACLQHPNICRLVAVCSRNGPRFLLTECLEGMRLDSYLATLDMSKNTPKNEILADIVVKLCSALKYLSSIQFIHRDISARNVIYGIGNVVKLTNTAAACPGYSDCYYYIKEKRCLYPIRWMAPEALSESVSTVQSDIWSFGVLLWEIYTHAKAIPFESQGNVEVLKQLQMLNTIGCGCMEYLPLKHLACPTLLLQVMRRCWHVAPGERITAEEIYNTLTN